MITHYLNHKNIKVASFSIEDGEVYEIGKIYEKERLPYLYEENTQKKIKLINSWISNRGIPFSREDYDQIMERYNVRSAKELTILAMGLNLTDHYWIATGRSGHEISPRAETLKNLVDKYGTNTLSLFLKEVNLYDGNIKALTEPEARALRRVASLDEARDRIFTARRQGNTRMGSENSQQDEYQTPRIDPSVSNHKRKLRW